MRGDMSNRRVIKAAAMQIAPVFMDKLKTVEKYCHYIVEAGREGAELIVTPETGIPTYPYWRNNFGYTSPETVLPWRETVLAYYENSLRIDGPETELLCKAARAARAVCVIGCSEQDDRIGSNTLYNTLLFIGPDGCILGRHRKLMPTHQERIFWGGGGGADLCVFDTPVGRLGGPLCFENHIRLLKAALAVKGEEIHAMAWPGWWSYGGERKSVRDMTGRTGPLHTCDQDSAIREYAFETQTFVVSANLYLPESSVPDDFPFKRTANFKWAIGGSAIVNPFGMCLVEPVFNCETIVYAELDMSDRIVAKNRATAWDITRERVVSLNINEEAPSPTPARRDFARPPAEHIERLARKYGLSADALEALIEELSAISYQRSALKPAGSKLLRRET